MEAIRDIERIENMLKIGHYLVMTRINFNGYRVYIQTEPEFRYYSGLTGALDKSKFKGDPDEKRLKGWRENFIDNFGQKNADNYLELTGEFGTLLHMALVTIKNKGKINWKEESELATEYFVSAYKKKRLEPDLKVINSMVYDYNKHVASLMQFVYDCVDQIFAIETIAKCEELKIATPIDMFCSCRQTPKGKHEKTTINIKTSSQISKHQLEQVAFEMVMWNQTYPDEMAVNTAILRTKDWKEDKAPTYEYKYMNAEEAGGLFKKVYPRLLLCLNSDATYYPNPTSRSFTGETKPGEMPEIICRTIQQEWELLKTEPEVIFDTTENNT